MFIRLAICLSGILIILPLLARATIQLPQNLSKGDRTQIEQIIGLGTSAKILSDPYPLGGYAGFEAGFSVESIPAQDISLLGNHITPAQQDVTLPKLTVGKGLYNNLDVFLQFTPYTSQDEIAQYGGIARWGFYQAPTLPASVSALVHFNSANISNVLSSRSYGTDVIGGINVDNVAIFAGLGYVEALGTFDGGLSNITDSKNQETEVVSSLHTVLGVDLRFSDYFLALQVDRYTQPVFSAKLGLRF